MASRRASPPGKQTKRPLATNRRATRNWKWPNPRPRPKNRRKSSRTCHGRKSRQGPATDSDTLMKSAYELAMERLNKAAPTVKLTEQQKKEIAKLAPKGPA